MANRGRRKTDKPGWYRSIPVDRTGWPACTRCGVKTSVVDHLDGECLRCRMEKRKAAREASA